MAASSYAACYQRVRVHEGGNDDDPRDPGGRTSRGIIQREWTPYVQAHPDKNLPADVWQGPDWAIDDIYKTKYWTTVHGDDLPAGIDDSVYDYGINSGPARANKVLRRCIGCNDNAPFTEVKVALAKRDAKAVVIAINDERLRFLQGLPTWPTFGKGWGRRVAEVRAFSLQLASTGPVSAAPGATPAPGKGHVPQPSPAAHTGGTAAAATTIGGVVHGWLQGHPTMTAAAIIVVVGAGIALFVWLKARAAAKQEAPVAHIVVPERTG